MKKRIPLAIAACVCGTAFLFGCAAAPAAAPDQKTTPLAATPLSVSKPAQKAGLSVPDGIFLYRGGAKTEVTDPGTRDAILKVIAGYGTALFTNETKSFISDDDLKKLDYVELRYNTSQTFPGKDPAPHYKEVLIILRGAQQDVAVFRQKNADGIEAGDYVTTLLPGISRSLSAIFKDS